jgi:hypothetical protein
LKCASEESQIVDFVLTKSTVSAGKKKRILYLLKVSDDFSHITDSSWEDLGIRNSLCRMAAATHAVAENDLPGEILSLEDHEAAWALLQAVAMDNKYLEQTEYNAFKLIRLGNQFSKEDPVCSGELVRPRSSNTDRSVGTLGNIPHGKTSTTPGG